MVRHAAELYTAHIGIVFADAGAVKYQQVGNEIEHESRNADESNVAAVNIGVNAVNDIPMASDGTATTNEDTAKDITLSATDIDGSTLTFSIISDPSQGMLSNLTPALPCTINGDGSSTCTATITYTPDANYNGPDSFTFNVNDGSVDSNTATISITVTPVNDPPVFLIRDTSLISSNYSFSSSVFLATLR